MRAPAATCGADGSAAASAGRKRVTAGDRPGRFRWASGRQGRVVLGAIAAVALMLAGWLAGRETGLIPSRARSEGEPDGLASGTENPGVGLSAGHYVEAARSAVWRWEGLTWRGTLGGDGKAAAAIRAEQAEVERWLAEAVSDGSLDGETAEAVEAMRAAMATYAGELERVLGRGRAALRRETAVLLGRDLTSLAAPVLGRISDLEALAAAGSSSRTAGWRLAGREGGGWIWWGVAGLVILGGGALGTALWRPDPAARAGGRHVVDDVGTLVAGLAHEIRNPMAVLRGDLSGSRRAGVGDSGDVARWLGEVRRMERILDDFLAYARPSAVRMERLEARTLMTSVADLVRRSMADRGIEVVSIGVGGPAWVEADPDQLRQVVLNLVRNAAESMPGGGRLSLGVSVGRRAGRVSRGIEEVRLEVGDQGPGIPEGVSEHLFEPFASKKPGGSGLGLAIASRLAQAQGGDLEYRAGNLGGTVFSVVLPRVEADRD